MTDILQAIAAWYLMTLVPQYSPLRYDEEEKTFLQCDLLFWNWLISDL